MGNKQGLYGFWEVMEIDNAFFQDLESFGKREVFQKGLWNSFGFLFGKILKHAKIDAT